MKYGFLDEAGDVAYTARATATFIVVVVVVGNPERLRKAAEKTWRIWHRYMPGQSELKASRQPSRITEVLLQHAARIGFEAVAVVIDKKYFPRPLDPEDLYRYACVQAVRKATEQFGPLLLLKLDRRYKTAKQRGQLEQALRGGIEGLRIQHEDSQRERVLQVADAVAWSLFQKHERKDETTWRIIQGKVIEVKL